MKNVEKIGMRGGAICSVSLVFVLLLATLAHRAIAAPLIASKVDVGWKHSCAVEPAGQLYCWGENASDQLNLVSVTTPPYYPGHNFAKPTNLLPGAVSGFDLGGHRTCVKNPSGQLQCWGVNLFGSTGPNPVAPAIVSGTFNPYANGVGGTKTPTPVAFPLGFTFGAASLGNEHSCVIRTGISSVAGEVWCWGLNSASFQSNVSAPPTQSGQLGSPTGIMNYNTSFNSYGNPTPQKVVGGALLPNTKMSHVAAAGYTTCSIESAPNAGQVWCWGQLGGNVYTPLKAKKQLGSVDFTDAKKIKSSQNTTCVIDSADKVFCAVHSIHGSLFVEIVGLPPVAKVAPGWMHGCALTTSSTVWCWGNNAYGTLGGAAPMTNTNYPPAQITSLSTVVDITSFFGHTCARMSNGELWCWGQNDAGQLGNCSYTPLTSGGINQPVQVQKSCDANPQAVNGVCGSSSGQAYPTAPTTNLCSSGTQPSVLTPITSLGQVTGWNWSCGGTNGGTNSGTCTAYVKGVCGSVNGTTVPTLFPNSPGLCGGSPATSFTNIGTGWTWTCPGGNGASTTDDVQCGATRGQSQVSGKCGPADNAGPFASAGALIAAGECATGSPTGINNTTTPGSWTWTCSGSPAMSCSAKDSSPPPPPPKCGTAHGGTYPWNGAPSTASLCAPPNTPSALTPPNGQNTVLPNTYQWSCTNSVGQSIQCLAKRTPPPPATVTVTPVAGAHCSISPSGPVTIASGSTASFTLGATSGGYVVNTVVSTCGGSKVGNVFTTNPTTTNCTVTVACVPCVGIGCQLN